MMVELLVWRSIAIVTVMLLAVLWATVAVRKRWPHLLIRVITTLVLFVALVFSGFAVDSLILSGNTSSGFLRVYIDPSPFEFALPAIVCLSAGALYWWVQRRRARL